MDKRFTKPRISDKVFASNSAAYYNESANWRETHGKSKERLYRRGNGYLEDQPARNGRIVVYYPFYCGV